MKSYQRLSRPARLWRGLLKRIGTRRKGTVIVIVLALLGILAFMGFFVLGITSQENQSATYFANSPTAKAVSGNLNADAFFNDILRQIIIGPAMNEQQSVLWGGNKALVPMMFGRDMATFNGQGINLIWNGTSNAPAVDQNYNNLAEDGTANPGSESPDNSALMQINLSPAAQGSLLNLNSFVGGLPYPEPDVSITYPDINNAFLAYDALVPNGTNYPVRVVIPSFHRPQILRSLGVPAAQWYTAAGTAKYVLHPHASHAAIDNNGNITATPRFLSLTNVPPTVGADGQPGVAGVDDDSDGTVDNATELGWGGSDDVPNIGLFPLPGDPGHPLLTVQEGIWTNIVPPGDPIQYGVDVDNTGDGVADSFYMDFGFPLMTDPSGNQFVALAAVKIIDADALLNLNVHGNRSGSAVLGGAAPPTPFGGASTFISTSDHGVSASEVNPEWALNARPVSGLPDFPGTPAALQAALQQHYLFFRSPAQGGLPAISDDHSAGSFELANIEWWNAVNGRPQLSPGANPATDPPTVSGSSFPGRWGETARLDNAVQAVVSFSSPIQTGPGSVTGDPFPLPGTSGVDDNDNAPEGGTYYDLQGIPHLAWVQPIDLYASGTWVTGTQGKVRGLIQQGLQLFPAYSQFFVNPSISWTTAFTATPSPLPLNWNGTLYPQIPLTAVTSPVMPSSGNLLSVDEADEEVTEPSLAANQPNDNIYAPSENSIQLGSADFTALGTPARTASLMPFNFGASARAAQIRQRFTSTSWDLKSFGKEFLGQYAGVNDARRLWEFTDLSGAGTGPFLFPPVQAGYLGGDNKPGVANVDDNGDGNVDDVGELGWPGSDDNLGPFRNDVACMMRVLADPNFQIVSPKMLAQRMLSINGITEQLLLTNPSTGVNYPSFRVRPLTPHPVSGLANTPIWDSSYGGSGSATGVPFPNVTRPEQLTAGNRGQQEWLARYDRQRLARDIYTLLYMFGGGADTAGVAAFNYTQDNSGRTLYTNDQLQEMAQFAVNVVDQLDPDDTISVFEYDKNLADGWNLDDNAFDGNADSAAPYNIPANDRGVVYGVERQTLALNESMIVFAQECINTTGNVPQDHPDTQWDDTKQWNFLYLELENVGAFPVNFQNEQWQIAIKESPIVATPSGYYSNEMRLIFQSSQPPVPSGPNAKLTIGGMVGSSNGKSDWNTSGTGENSGTLLNINGATSAPYPSYMVIDPNDTTGAPANSGNDYQFPIAPRAAFVSPSSPPFGVTTALNLDLSQPTQASQYWVVPPSSTSPTADGTPIPNTPFPGGTQMLQFNDPIPSPPSVPGITLTTPIILRIELKRRVDLNRAAIIPGPTSNDAVAADNPWIVVDHMDVPVSKLVLKITGSPNDYAPQIDAQLTDTTSPGLVSTERSEPLYHDFQLNPFNPTTSNPTTPNGPYIVASSSPYPRNGGASTRTTPLFQANSLGMDNDAADNDSNPATVIPPHPRYQPHYDRDFTSVVELGNVPLWGPYGPSSPNGMNLGGVSTGNTVALTSGLAHLMASRITEAGAPLASGPANPTPELLAGADYIPTDTSAAKQHYSGYGTAGFRFQHPEGSDQTNYNPQSDFTENRWYRLLGFVEVPTRSHRGLDPAPFAPYQVNAGSIGGPLGFYRTPGKINLNTLRHPDVVAALIGEPDIFTLQYTAPFAAGQNFTTGLSMPSLLPDITGDMVQNAPPQSPTIAGPVMRDWWEQFIATRDGVDPITGLSIPGVPRATPGNPPTGSHPFRNSAFAAFGGPTGSGVPDVNGYNGPLESTLLRSLSGDVVTPPTTSAPGNFDQRRRLFELGTLAEHTGSAVDYATKQRLLSRLVGNTTTRSNVFFVWIQVDFFAAKDVSGTTPPSGVVRVGAKLGTSGVPGTSPGYRGFFVVDRSQALQLMSPQYLPTTSAGNFVFSLNQSFNYQSLILYRQRIQ